MIEIKIKNQQYYGNTETVKAASITYDASCFNVVKNVHSSQVWTNGQPPSWNDQAYNVEISVGSDLKEMLEWYKLVRYQIPKVNELMALSEMTTHWMGAKTMFDLEDPRVKNAFVNLLLVAKLSKEDTQKGIA